MTFEEQLAQIEEVAQDPNTATIAVERVRLFVEMFEKSFEMLAPDDDDAKDMYETFVENYLGEWLSDYFGE